MKEGWKTQTLGEVAKIAAGNSAPQDESLLKNGTYPFFRTADAGRVRFGDIYESADYLNENGIKGLRRFPKGTILFPKSGASTFLNHRVMMGVEGYVSSHLATIVADETQVNRRFLLYYLTTIVAQGLIQDHAYPSLNLPAIAGISIQVPTLPEQQRIVGILDEAFDGIATAKANAEKNLQNARALFEGHLNAIFTQRGKGWKHITLGSICERVSVGYVGPISSYYCDPDNGVPFLRSQNVRSGRLDWEGVQYITRDFHESLRKSQLRVGDLLFVRVGANRGDCCAIYEHIKDLNCANIVFARPTQGNAAYLERYCQSPPGRGQLLGMTTGAAQGVINTLSVAELIVPLPSPTEQEMIVAALDALAVKTQRLESIYQRKLAALEELKKSLLHEAFNGEL